MPDETQQPSQPAVPTTQGPKMTFDPKDVEENKFIACLSYVGILFLVPLLAAKTSKYAQEHAKQGLVMFLAGIVGSFIFWFPVIGWALALAFLIVDILALVKCLTGEFWEIPVIGQYRSKFKI